MIWARTSLGQSHRSICSRIWKNFTQLWISMSIEIKNTMTLFHLDRPKFQTSPSGFKIARHNPCQSLATKPTLATIQGDISLQIKHKLKSRLNAKTSFSSMLRTWAMSEDEAIHVWIWLVCSPTIASTLLQVCQSRLQTGHNLRSQNQRPHLSWYLKSSVRGKPMSSRDGPEKPKKSVSWPWSFAPSTSTSIPWWLSQWEDSAWLTKSINE